MLAPRDWVFLAEGGNETFEDRVKELRFSSATSLSSVAPGSVRRRLPGLMFVVFVSAS